MSEIQKILNWINTNASVSVGADGSTSTLGYLDCLFQYQQTAGTADPLRLTIAEAAELTLNIGQKFKFHAPRRIGFTPFLYIYGRQESMDVRFIDFFRTGTPAALIRIILFQFFDQYEPPVFTISGARHKEDEHALAVGREFCLKPGGGWKTEWRDDHLRLIPMPDRNGYGAAILQAGRRSAFLEHDDAGSAFRALQAEERICSDKSPAKYMVSGQRGMGTPHEMWFRQREITPDGNIDPSILSEPQTYVFRLPWLLMLSEYLPDTAIRPQLQKSIERYMAAADGVAPRLAYMAVRLLDREIVPNTAPENDPFARVLGSVSGQQPPADDDDLSPDLFYTALFGPSPDTGRITTRLQHWWNRYAMPVYSLMWRKRVATDIELWLVIYLLAVRYRMPWTEHLLARCDDFRPVPLFGLIAGLAQKIMLCRQGDRSLWIAPGPDRNGNVTRTAAGNPAWRAAYTRFGKETYYSLYVENRLQLKIDKEVVCRISPDVSDLELFPHVFPAPASGLPAARLHIAAERKNLSVPLCWRQGMVQFGDLRVRWLLKKKRFQLTLQAAREIGGYRLNDEEIKLERGKRLVRYILPEKVTPAGDLAIFSREGKTLHFRQRADRRTVRLLGWLHDPFGVFYPAVNYRIRSRQHVIAAETGGQGQKMIHLAADTDRISLQAKGVVRTFPLKCIGDARFESFLRYDPAVAPEHCFLIIGKDDVVDLPDLVKYFESEFGFFPEIIRKKSSPSGILIGWVPADSEIPAKLLALKSPVRDSVEHLMRQQIYHLQG